MPRSIWTGSISFGLVSIPVKVVSATSSEHTVRFRQLHKEDLGQVRYRKVCELDQEELAADDIVRGYEAADGRIAVVTDPDLADLPLPTAHTIEVSGFVEIDTVDPLRLGKSYYLTPDKTGAKPYTLMREALRRNGKGAVAKLAMRGHEILALIRVHDDILLMTQLLWPDEINSTQGIAPEGRVTVTDPELDLADVLIDTLGAADLDAYSDDYLAAVEELVAAKLENATVRTPATTEAQAPQGKVVDLMALLQRSVSAARDSRRSADDEQPEQVERPERSRRRPAAEQTATGSSGGRARKSTADRHLQSAPEPSPKAATARKSTARTAAKKAGEKKATEKKTAEKKTPAPAKKTATRKAL
ncbi:DNA end-binding protein Ku [Streptacidiphilus sp. MAP12-16]|uniref:non-homologous end joining protein Ku n=1 Tax=Streptacidiphilus sp. MAP12-16 TaxID=3156300 RepID=UPI00351661DA